MQQEELQQEGSHVALRNDASSFFGSRLGPLPIEYMWKVYECMMPALALTKSVNHSRPEEENSAAE